MSESNVLGIDHPVISVRNLEQACRHYQRLGFQPAPEGRHPWGTANHLIMFRHDFIELLGVYDDALLDREIVPNSTVYSGFVRAYLERTEGFSLMALHSDAIERDHDAVQARGLQSSGRIEFRRPVILPDGTDDEAVVSLSMLIHPDHRNVSTFICQQHKPELVWVPDWQEHPNRVDSIRSVTYVADDPLLLVPYYQALYGRERVHKTVTGLEINTPNGAITVLSTAMIANRFPEIDGLLPAQQERPCGIAITVHSSDLNAVIGCLTGSGVPYVAVRDNCLRVGQNYACNVFIEFIGD